MIYLSEILTYINNSVQIPPDLLNQKYLEAEIVNYEIDGKKFTRPFVSQNEAIDFTDTKGVILYHKLISESFTKLQGYGNADLIVQKASMQLVCLTQDDRININNTAAYLSSVLSVGSVGNLGLPVHRIVLDLQGITYQTFSILKSDFGFDKNDLRAKAFAINYTIECTYQSDCINICCSNG